MGAPYILLWVATMTTVQGMVASRIDVRLLDGPGIENVTSLDTTEPLERAMRFYERNGFRRSGVVRDFFGMPLIEYSQAIGLVMYDGANSRSRNRRAPPPALT